MARGRKPKQKVPEQVQQIIDSVDKEFVESLSNITQPIISKVSEKSNFDWDVRIEDTIDYFDPTLSYELTGYRPVDETRGLDFDPSWFTETREIKLRTGKYCAYPAGTKKYNDFWTEEHRRCNEGFSSHGYRITGDNYFFLNYYRLKDTAVKVAGSGRTAGFPQFFSKQYEYFHYIELCEHLKKDVCALKARGVGQH